MAIGAALTQICGDLVTGQQGVTSVLRRSQRLSRSCSPADVALGPREGEGTKRTCPGTEVSAMSDSPAKLLCSHM